MASLLCRLGARRRRSHHFWPETTNHCTEGDSPLEREGGRASGDVCYIMGT